MPEFPLSLPLAMDYLEVKNLAEIISFDALPFIQGRLDGLPAKDYQIKESTAVEGSFGRTEIGTVESRPGHVTTRGGNYTCGLEKDQAYSSS